MSRWINRNRQISIVALAYRLGRTQSVTFHAPISVRLPSQNSSWTCSTDRCPTPVSSRRPYFPQLSRGDYSLPETTGSRPVFLLSSHHQLARNRRPYPSKLAVFALFDPDLEFRDGMQFRLVRRLEFDPTSSGSKPALPRSRFLPAV